MKLANIFAVLLMILSAVISRSLWAGECSAVFTGGVGGNANSGSIYFGQNSVIYDNPTNQLVAVSIDTQSQGYTCVTEDCTATGTTTETMDFSPFQTTHSHTELNIEKNRSGTMGTTTNEYKKVQVGKHASLSVSGNYNYYEIKELIIGQGAIATFPPGDYWIETFKLELNAQVVISGNGTARFYVKNETVIGQNAQFNVTYDNGYHPENMMLYSKGEVKLEINSHVAGFIYSEDKVTFGQNTITRGSVSMESGRLEQNARIYYMGDALTEVESNGYCSTTPLHHYEIIHDGSGSVCGAEAVTIKACANADCLSLYTSSTSVDLRGDGSTLGSETFTGSVSTYINHTTSETLTLSLANTSVSAENPLQCDDGNGGSSCDIVFSSATCPVAGSCEAVFQDGLNNSDVSGKITFENSGRLSNNNDIFLTTKTVELDGNATTCETADCVAAGYVASTMSSSYTSYTSRTDFKISGSTATITGNDFEDVEVKNHGTLNMSAGYSSYYFKKLRAKSGSVLNMTPGDYYVEEFEVDDATMNVVGSGTVRIWAKDKVKLRDNATVNGGSNGFADKLFIYFFAQDDNVVKIDNGAYVAGYVYSANKVRVRDNSKFYGAITAVGKIEVSDSAEVITRLDRIGDADFGAGCTSSNPSVDHYRFEYDGNGLTCAVQSVVIKACADANCSSLYDSQSNIGFAVTADNNTVTSNIAFTGSIAVNVAESSPQTVSMGLASASPSATLQCYQNGQLDGNCDYVLEDTGFIFLDSDSNNQIIPTQISGKASNEGANQVNLALQAVQTDTTTGACVPLFADAAGVDVQLAMQCENPNSCITLANNANDLVFSNNGNDYYLSNYPAYGSHRLYFDNQSKAAFSIKYPDAGQIKLHAKMSIVLSDSETKVMLGNSNSFVVRPFGFNLSAGGNQQATNNQGNAYRKAGENFNLTVAAVQWQSADDCDNNAQVDINVNCNGNVVSADLSDNAVTPNFGQETQSESVSVATAIVSPVGGDSPALTNANFSVFTAGIQTNVVSWGNVGVFSATAGLGDDGVYLNTDAVTGYLPYVGRFVPSYFELDSAIATQGCSAFSYMGQDFNLSFEVLAKGEGGITLSNYDSSLSPNPATDTDYHGLGGFTLVAENNNDGENLGARVSAINYTWSDGVASAVNTLQFDRDTNGSFPVMDGPYDNVKLGLLSDDGDATASVDFNVKDIDATSSIDCVAATNCNAKSLVNSDFVFRFGRLAGAEVFGPQSENLTLPLTTQYWNGSKFVTTANDSCTVLTPADVNISGDTIDPFSANYAYTLYDASDGSDTGATTTIIIDGNTTTTTVSAEAGKFDLTFSPPNVIGTLPVVIDISAYPWLQYDWSSNGTGDVETSLPTYNVNFGQFRGNDRVIYWREKR